MGRKKNPTSEMGVAEKLSTPLAQRLNELITDSNELKDFLGCSIQAINQYKLGISRPSLENLCKIAGFYGVSSDYLLGLSNTSSTEKNIQVTCKTTGLSEQAVNRIILETAPLPGEFMPESEFRQISALDTLLTSAEFWKFVRLLGAYADSPKQTSSFPAEVYREHCLVGNGTDPNPGAAIKDILAYKAQRAFIALLDELDSKED